MDRSPLAFASAAAVAGIAWGYLRYRRSRRATFFSLLQALEWFVAYGGAAALLEAARRWLEQREEDELPAEVERITHIRRFGRSTGTEG